jgi:hypothetical protein
MTAPEILAEIARLYVRRRAARVKDQSAFDTQIRQLSDQYRILRPDSDVLLSEEPEGQSNSAVYARAAKARLAS